MRWPMKGIFRMKIKMFFLTGIIFAMSTVQAATYITNLTPDEVELTIIYVEDCYTKDYDVANPYNAVFKVVLPSSAKIDISGSAPSNRQKSSCYKDIVSIEAAINTYGDHTTRLSRVWQDNDLKNILNKPNWIIKKDSRGLQLQ